MSAVGGRRTYTEEELQAALRDIQSGKLGTRRAAVIYGIPRSTLRNKVYKLAMERERETHLVTGPMGPLTPLVADDDAMDDDKELSGAEEEKEVEKTLQGPLVSMADFVRIGDTPDALRNLIMRQQYHQKNNKDGVCPPEMWPGLEHSAFGPYLQLIMANQLAAGGAAAKEAEYMPMLPEIMRKIIAEEQQHLNNGENSDGTKALSQPSPSNSVKAERLKTDSSDMDTDDSPANVILKIPSFRPTTSKNGGDAYRSETGALVSPPVTSESGSPPIIPGGSMLALREVIAKSISQKFQQSPEPLKIHPAVAVEIDFKRGLTPPIVGLPPNTLLKNHQPPSEPPTPPASATAAPPLSHPTSSIVHTRNFQTSSGGISVANNNSSSKQNNSSNSSGSNQGHSSGGGVTTGGKGTRPKRGKYRNYDRDSLVEAVRAVQRGEMSVHRAGSYYGVPHSTLEYKVKERHLMRPRKRDPKPNPVDEKIASIKSQEIRNIPDKMKPVIKPPQKYPPTSPNGMKMPAMFDAGMAPLGYTPPPFPFWPHPSFPHLPLEYPRNPSTSQFPPNPEFFASQMMQRLQEQSIRIHPDAAATGATTPGTANGNVSAAGTPNAATLTKSAREMAESLYEGPNGSFLDGIIRSSLESGVSNAAANKTNHKEDTKSLAPETTSNNALLDQLCRNSRITPLPKASSATTEANSSGDESYRQSSSPLNFATTKHDGKNRSDSSGGDEIHTIELSNESNDSVSGRDDGASPGSPVTPQMASTTLSTPPRIYVKPQFQELTKPENLKPEVLVRFSSAMDDDDDECDDEVEPMMMERNGIAAETAIGSASDTPNVAQDWHLGNVNSTRFLYYWCKEKVRLVIVIKVCGARTHPRLLVVVESNDGPAPTASRSAYTRKRCRDGPTPWRCLLIFHLRSFVLLHYYIVGE